MSKRKVFYYITDEYSKTVRDSQVTEWIAVTDKHNIHFNLIIITSIKYILSNNSFRVEKIRNIKKTIKGKILQIPVIKRNDKTGLSAVSNTIILSFVLLKHFVQGERVVIQTRVLHIDKTLKILKKIFPQLKIIFDNRGASAEEYINALGLRNISETNSLQTKRNYNNLIRKLQNFTDTSDVIFTVSDKLSQYVAESSKVPVKSKIHVIPGAADDTKFYFNNHIRSQYRRILNISNETKLFVFTGGLKAHWHMKDFMFQLMSITTSRSNNNHFLCITPDIKIANHLQEKFQLPANKTTLLFSQHSDVNNYLNAADFGLLLREDIITNNVASPTKFSEYLLCGLPVIVSKHVGDYSDYVEANDCGICVNNDLATLPERLDSLRIFETRDRYEIAKKSRNFFSKQRLIQKRINIYNNI